MSGISSRGPLAPQLRERNPSYEMCPSIRSFFFFFSAFELGPTVTQQFLLHFFYSGAVIGDLRKFDFSLFFFESVGRERPFVFSASEPCTLHVPWLTARVLRLRCIRTLLFGHLSASGARFIGGSRRIFPLENVFPPLHVRVQVKPASMRSAWSL